jgi:SPP1 family predicted phage head-tail adaptor
VGIEASEIAEARADALAELFNDEATIQRASVGSDGGGGQTESWSNIATVPCTIAAVGGGEAVSLSAKGTTGIAGDRIDSRSTHVVTVTADTDVKSSDRLEVSGVVYEVNLVRTRGELEIIRRIEVKEFFG